MKYVVVAVIFLIAGLVIMDYINYNFAKKGGFVKRGGIFENTDTSQNSVLVK